MDIIYLYTEMSIISKLTTIQLEKYAKTGGDKEYQDFRDLQEELSLIKKDWTRAKIKAILNEDYRLGRLGEQEKIMYEHQQENEKLLKIQTAKKHNNQYAWITVRPKPTVKWEEFYKLSQKLFERQIFNSGYMVYEQAGTTEEDMGIGFHAHLCMERNLNYKPFKCEDNAYNTVKKICNKQAGFKCQHIGEDFKKDKLNYIFSLKTGEGKEAKQLMDIPWRESLQLPTYYER